MHLEEYRSSCVSYFFIISFPQLTTHNIVSLIFYSYLVIEYLFRFHHNKPIRSRLRDNDVELKYSEAAATSGGSSLNVEDQHPDEALGSANLTGKLSLLSSPTRQFLIGMGLSLSFLFVR